MRNHLGKNLIKEGKSLDNTLREAFAVFKEATLGTLGIKHFDVQVQGAAGDADSTGKIFNFVQMSVGYFLSSSTHAHV